MSSKQKKTGDFPKKKERKNHMGFKNPPKASGYEGNNDKERQLLTEENWRERTKTAKGRKEKKQKSDKGQET